MPDHISCLIVDHDDTVVDSSQTVHYPAYLETMERLRPDIEPVTLEGWFLKNFHPGIMEYFTKELEFTEREMSKEYEVWRSFVTSRQPQFYPGAAELLLDFKRAGGHVVVVSHSEADMILRDYRAATQGRLAPDLVFGWEMEEEKRKPSPWPILETMKSLHLRQSEILTVDDLKPGAIMAHSAGVAIGAAGWGHDIPEIRAYMIDHCDYYFHTINDLRNVILPS